MGTAGSARAGHRSACAVAVLFRVGDLRSDTHLAKLPSNSSSLQPSHHLPTPPTPGENPHRNSSGGLIADRVARVINLIRPAVQADGGDIELVGITPENVVQIRMHGACVGCPSSAVTLQMGIERNLKEHVPEVRGLLAVD